MSASSSTTQKRNPGLRVKWNRIEPILIINKNEEESDNVEDKEKQSEKTETKGENDIEEGSYILSVLSPSPRFYTACTIVHTKGGETDISNLRMIIFGGYGQSVLNDSYAYRFDSNQWTKNLTEQNENAPSPRYGHSLVTVLVGENECAIIFGGKVDEEHYLGDMYSLNLQDRKWKLVHQENPIKGRAHHSAVVHKNVIYVFGGSDDELLYDELWTFEITTGKWSIKEKNNEQAAWPNPRDNHSAVIYNDSMYVFGGMDNEGTLDELWRYDISKNEWEKLTSKGATRRAGHIAVVYKSAMFIYGGVDQNDVSATYMSDMWAFNFMNKKWHTVSYKKKKREQTKEENEDNLDEELFVQDLEPTSRANHSAVIIPENGNLYVFGGFASDFNGQTLFDDFDTSHLPDVGTIFFGE